jgi:hypothetical protein
MNYVVSATSSSYISYSFDFYFEILDYIFVGELDAIYASSELKLKFELYFTDY